jgi:hypothetical protein
MSYEIKYCGDCHCNHSFGITSEICKKRFFDIALPTSIYELRLVFCAEYLRSCIQTEMIKRDTTYLSNIESKHILEKIIIPHLPKIVAGGYNPKKSRINNIYFTVNKKLGIFCTYTFEECLEFIINNQEARFTNIVNSVVYELNNYCLSKQTYLKYKSTVANLIRLSKQLKKTCISNEQIAIICCEIMTIILMSESEVKKQNKIILNN